MPALDDSESPHAVVPVPRSTLSVAGHLDAPTAAATRRRSSFFAESPTSMSATRGPSSPIPHGTASRPVSSSKRGAHSVQTTRRMARHLMVGAPFTSADVMAWCMADAAAPPVRSSLGSRTASPQKTVTSPNLVSEDDDITSAPGSPVKLGEPYSGVREFARSESSGFPIFEGSNDEVQNPRLSSSRRIVARTETALSKLAEHDKSSRLRSEVATLRAEQRGAAEPADAAVPAAAPQLQLPPSGFTVEPPTPLGNTGQKVMSSAMRKFRTATSALRAQRKFRTLKPSSEQMKLAELRAAKALSRRDAMLRVATDLAFRGVRYTTVATPRVAVASALAVTVTPTEFAMDDDLFSGTGSWVQHHDPSSSQKDQPAFLQSLRVERSHADQPLFDYVPAASAAASPVDHAPSGTSFTDATPSVSLRVDGRPPHGRRRATEVPADDPLSAPGGASTAERTTTHTASESFAFSCRSNLSGSIARSQHPRHSGMPTCTVAYRAACDLAGFKPNRSVVAIFATYDEAVTSLDTVRRSGTPDRTLSKSGSPLGFAGSARPRAATTPDLTAAEARLVLDFSNTYCGPKGVACVIAALEFAPELTALNLHGCGLDDTMASLLCDELRRHCPRLKSLDVSDNPGLSLTAGSHLYALAHSLRKLTTLHCHNTRLRKATVRSIERRCESNRERVKSFARVSRQRSQAALRITEAAITHFDSDSSSDSSLEELSPRRM